MQNSSQLHAESDTGPRTRTVPQPYPGCDVCAALLRHWIAATEPASPTACDVLAAQFAKEINEHRKTDEAAAPAL